MKYPIDSRKAPLTNFEADAFVHGAAIRRFAFALQGAAGVGALVALVFMELPAHVTQPLVDMYQAYFSTVKLLVAMK